MLCQWTEILFEAGWCPCAVLSSRLVVPRLHLSAQVGQAHKQCWFQGCTPAVLVNCMHACTTPSCLPSIQSSAGLAWVVAATEVNCVHCGAGQA